MPVLRVARALLGRRQHLPRPLQKMLYLLAMLCMSWTLWRERNSYDVLQVCQFSMLVLPLALVCRLTRKPIVIVVISARTGQAPVPGPLHLLAGSLHPEPPWLTIDKQSWIDGDLCWTHGANKIPAHLLCALLRPLRGTIIVLSTRMQRYVNEQHCAALATQLIPNGVDISRFQPLPRTPADGKWSETVVCLSKLRYEKGIDVLLHAWHLVITHRPTARLVIVGDGPLRRQLVLLAEALGITSSVEFAGLRQDVPAQLQRGAIAVLPSRWEGMPNALLEAMATGCACIATRVSGSEDLIEHEKNGLLVPEEDYIALAHALLTFLQNPALAQRFGKAAHALIEQSYTLEHILQQYIAIYTALTYREQKRAKPFPIHLSRASTNSLEESSNNTRQPVNPN